MRFSVEAACGCHIGKIRKNNEDNFLFNGFYLPAENQGTDDIISYSGDLQNGFHFAVFDGMGGENFGEIAAFEAAKKMQSLTKTFSDYFLSKTNYLEKQIMQLNEAVVKAKKELFTDRCGCTMVALYFYSDYVYSCNVGDSRACRLRNGKLLQLSVDHIVKYPGSDKKKTPLTQHLGISPEDMLIEPYITKEHICKNDIYLICSDGITDMLTDLEISEILSQHHDIEATTRKLIQSALDNGGRDNITAIACKII